MVLVIDPQIAGISGDMFLCSLVGLGADRGRIIDGVTKSAKFLDGTATIDMEFRSVQKHGTRALELILNEHRRDESRHSGERSGAEIKDVIVRSTSSLGLSGDAASFVTDCIDALVRAESHIHGIPEDAVMLHEASGIDTLVDIVGAGIALDELGLFGEQKICMPICVGNGSVTFSHGIMSNPAEAILEILQGSGLAISGSPASSELTTPTGACILAGLRPEYAEFYPKMQITSVGYGAGRANFDSFANVLKITYGREYSQHTTIPDGCKTDKVYVLETNVDDVSGEILGGLIGKMMDAGARDASIYHGLTKKGRPTSLVSVMCHHDMCGALVGILMAETGTLGVRVSESKRIIAPRRSHTIRVTLEGVEFDVRYKQNMLRGADGFKIEFEDLARISKQLNISVSEAELQMRMAIKRAHDCGMSSPSSSPSSPSSSSSSSSTAASDNNNSGNDRNVVL